MKYLIIGVGIEASNEPGARRLAIDIGFRSTTAVSPRARALAAAALTVTLFLGSLYLLEVTDLPSQQTSTITLYSQAK